MTTPVSVYMRSVRSRLHWQYHRWHETGLETTLKPLLQIGSDVSENELRTVRLRISMTTAAVAAASGVAVLLSFLLSLILGAGLRSASV